MNAPFSITYDWLPPNNEDSEEQGTRSDLSINVGDFCATVVEDLLAKSVRPSIRVSALPLAEWFATNWWRLLWEPQEDTRSWRMSHKVGSVGGGYVWSNLSFSSDCQTIRVEAEPTNRRAAEPIRYLNRFVSTVAIADFEHGAADFIAGTLARLSGVGKGSSDLAELWAEITEERRNPELARWRILEAIMGYDPDEAPEGLIDGLQEQAKRYGDGAMRELTAAAKDETLSQLDGIRAAAQDSGATATVPNCAAIRQGIKAFADAAAPPWQRAEQAAQRAREVWELEVPVATERLAELFRVSSKQLVEPQHRVHTTLAAGFRDDDQPDLFSISWNSNHPTSRRFTLARLVGDHITAPEQESLLPGTRAGTSRQKFQRAFAQELLCPFADLKEFIAPGIPDDEDIAAAAEHFSVSPLTVQNILVNKRAVDREVYEGWAR